MYLSQKAGKMRIKIFITSILLLVTGTSGFAQSVARAGATASVITPITITKLTDMNFGNVAVTSGTGGSVILTTSDTRSAGGSGGVTLPSTSGTVAAAAFTVSGAPGFTYGITLPSSCILTDGSSHTMTVSSFVSSPSASGTISSGGSQTLKVSATMTVAPAQAPGSYTNTAAVPVTVNYN